MSSTRQGHDGTFVDVALQRFDALCEAAAFSAATRAYSSRLIRELLMPWGEWQVGSSPPVASDITDDHGPLEFSLALSGNDAEVRLLFETLGTDDSLHARWQQACRLNERLGQRGHVVLDRLARVQDLFIPQAPNGRFAMWHSLCLAKDGEPRFKVYLNPQARGSERASEVVAEAIRRLGFSAVTAGAIARLSRREDEIRLFSLDLDACPGARVKVYKVHHRATCPDIERELAKARGASPQELSTFWRAFAPDAGPCTNLPMSTYLSLTSESDQPSTATLHFPVRGYAKSDQEVYERVRAYLGAAERAIYEKAITAFASRALDAGIGMQSYVSYRQHAGAMHLTVYLAPELYAIEPARKAVA